MLKLYDTAQGRIVEVIPRTPGKFSMYCCGPTVYDLPHIGHGRAMVTWDFIRRYIEWTGLEVHHVANVTDVDDNIINRAAKLGLTPKAVAERYEAEWWAATDRLGARRPVDQPHASAYVERMVAVIAELIDRGYAYDTKDTVYFSSSMVEDYGLLARQTVESLRSGARVDVDDEKRSPIDFALWKKASGPHDLPQWPSPWGAGRPGWHTECVVMSLDILGDGFDLHGGGLDLMFPHHENERAQAVALGRDFSRHWVHHGFIEVGGEKMSKSLNNFTSLTDMLDRVDPRAYRLLVLRAHYRSPLDVTPELVAESESALSRFDGLARRVGGAPTYAAGRGSAAPSPELAAFDEAMSNDLDTPASTAILFDLLRRANVALDGGAQAVGEALATTAFEVAGALGLFASVVDDALDAASAARVAALDAARAAKDFGRADAIRAQLQADGWVVEQTREGTTVHK